MNNTMQSRPISAKGNIQIKVPEDLRYENKDLPNVPKTSTAKLSENKIQEYSKPPEQGVIA